MTHNFSSIACPLTNLTKKGQPEKVHWIKEAEQAFQELKAALTASPVLHAPDHSCPFILQTDTSDIGVGAVLSQVQEGEEHPIATSAISSPLLSPGMLQWKRKPWP